MSSGLLPDHIEPLVDRLRAGDHLPIALPDVAAVTEVLMRSLESYFKSIDLTLYKECQDLADYIEDARVEISSLSPEHDDTAGIPRAGQELDAIVEATESATDTIMQAAEDLMSFDSDNFDEYKEHVNTEVMKIFEACSFQDITGQRISKVVGTLNQVEDRVGKLISILGITSNGAVNADARPILDPQSEDFDDDDLLSGPALAGEGIDQGEVDSLMDDFDPVISDAHEEPDVQSNSAVETSDETPDGVDHQAKASDVVADEKPEEPSNEDDGEKLVLEEEVDATVPAETKTEAITGNVHSQNTETLSKNPADQQEVVDPVVDDVEIDARNPDEADLANSNDVESSENKTGETEETSQEDIDSLFA